MVTDGNGEGGDADAVAGRAVTLRQLRAGGRGGGGGRGGFGGRSSGGFGKSSSSKGMSASKAATARSYS